MVRTKESYICELLSKERYTVWSIFNYAGEKFLTVHKDCLSCTARTELNTRYKQHIAFSTRNYL